MTLLTVRQAASRLGVGYSTLKHWIYEGRVRTRVTSGGHHRIVSRGRHTQLLSHLRSNFVPRRWPMNIVQCRFGRPTADFSFVRTASVSQPVLAQCNGHFEGRYAVFCAAFAVRTFADAATAFLARAVGHMCVAYGPEAAAAYAALPIFLVWS